MFFRFIESTPLIMVANQARAKAVEAFFKDKDQSSIKRNIDQCMESTRVSVVQQVTHINQKNISFPKKGHTLHSFTHKKNVIRCIYSPPKKVIRYMYSPQKKVIRCIYSPPKKVIRCIHSFTQKKGHSLHLFTPKKVIRCIYVPKNSFVAFIHPKKKVIRCLHLFTPKKKIICWCAKKKVSRLYWCI